MKLLIYQNSKLDFERSFAFQYLYKQSFSGEQPRARGPSYFKTNFFEKKKFRTISVKINSLNPDQPLPFVKLIWIKTVCKGYQQATLAGKE